MKDISAIKCSKAPGSVWGRFARSPWSWIPTLYVAEGLPYFAVNVLTVLVYTQLGVPVGEMALLTGWLYLPWVVKPFWSPFVDIIRTKRWWVLAMQCIIALAMAGVVFTLSLPHFLIPSLVVFWIMGFASATHDIAADGYYMLALDKEQQAAYVGVRSTFYRIASFIGQGGVVWLAGYFQDRLGAPGAAWQLTFAILSAFFLAIFLWHTRFLRRSASDRPVTGGKSASDIIREFGSTFVTFFQKRHIWVAMAFMLLYRLPEAFCVKILQPFMIAAREEGGLGLNLKAIGIINGTVGVLALLVGGILGGLMISRGGLKRWLWPMALALTLPCMLYCFLAQTQPESHLLIGVALAIEQFGYGFGFSAFMMYMIYFADGREATSHYAFCTGFMALGMMLPGMVAGKALEACAAINPLCVEGNPQYVNFFWLVMLLCLPTMVATWMVRRTL